MAAADSLRVRRCAAVNRDFLVVPYRPEYEDALLALSRLVWTEDPQTNRAYLRWKHEDNPYIDGPVFYLAMHQGELIGMRGLIGAKWEIGDMSFCIPCFGDSATLSQYRRQGVMNAITMRALEHLEVTGYPFVFSFSAGRATRRALLNSQAISIEMPQGFVADVNGNERTHHARHGCIEVADGIWLDTRVRANEMAALSGRGAQDGRVRHVRDAEYLRWRMRNPLASYWFLYHIAAGELKAYAILHKSVKGARDVLNIIDFEAPDAGVLIRLLGAAVRLGAKRISIWPTVHDIAERLPAIGFRPDRDAFRYRILVGSVSGAARGWRLGPANLADPSAWDMRMLFSDNY